MKFNDINNPEDLLNYMNENVVYGFIGNNKKIYKDTESEEWLDWYNECRVQTGEEILKTNVGTCWDQVELERLWFEKHNYEFKTIFIYFEVDHENNFPTHSFLIFKENDKWYWFEHAFGEYEGIYEFDSIEDAIKYIKNAFLNRAIEMNCATIDDKNLIRMYEFNKFEKKLTVDEYINHVTIGGKLCE